MHKFIKSQAAKGMTLLEVMIAVAVLAIALTGTLSLWISAEREASLAKEESIALAAINQVIADMRATEWRNIPTYFTNGYFDGTGASYRYNPAYFRSAIDWDAKSAVGIALSTLPCGVQVSQTPSPGAMMIEGRYYSPLPINSGTYKAEMRVILINDECPVESELGESGPVGDGDGLDLDRDGVISTQPMLATVVLHPPPPVGPVAKLYSPLGTDTVSLFPRHIAIGTKAAGAQIGVQNTYTHYYWPINQLMTLPVAVQIRWWSKAGMPRVITVVTFLTNRSGNAGF